MNSTLEGHSEHFFWELFGTVAPEVIERDRVFGPLLRKVKSAYDSMLHQVRRSLSATADLVQVADSKGTFWPKPFFCFVHVFQIWWSKKSNCWWFFGSSKRSNIVPSKQLGWVFSRIFPWQLAAGSENGWRTPWKLMVLTFQPHFGLSNRHNLGYLQLLWIHRKSPPLLRSMAPQVRG